MSKTNFPMSKYPFDCTTVSENHDALFKEGNTISQTDYCGFFLCTQGSMQINFEDSNYLIKSGDLYVYFPFSQVRVVQKSEYMDGYLITYSTEAILSALNSTLDTETGLFIRNHPFTTLNELQFKELSHWMILLRERLKRVENSPQEKGLANLDHSLLKSLSYVVYYELIRCFVANEPILPIPQDRKDVIFRNFLFSLALNYHTQREVSFYAAEQHLTPRYFSSIVKEKSGVTALRWIEKKTISEAKVLLTSSNLSIKEIAANFNFPNQSFFGKYFKLYAGVSPKKFRVQSLKKI